MKITKSQLRTLIREALDNEPLVQEAHGLDKDDKKALRDFIKNVKDENIKRILNFIIKSNVNVDNTQDVTKMKKNKK